MFTTIKEDYEVIKRMFSKQKKDAESVRLTGLLCCPFCGSKPVVERNSTFGYTSVYCPNDLCSVTRQSRAGEDDGNAIKAWNTRAT